MITFRKFDKTDWEAFAGCESDQPMIAEFADRFSIVIDDCRVEVVDNEHDSVFGGKFSDDVEAANVAKAIADSFEVLPITTWDTLMRGCLRAYAIL